MIRLGPISNTHAINLLKRIRNTSETVAPLGATFRYMSDWDINDTVVGWDISSPDQERCIIYDNPKVADSSQLHSNHDFNPAGFVSLTNINFPNRSAEFSIQLDSNATGRGLGTGATKLMLAHGFNNLNLHRIYLYVLQDNIVARNCFEKCGFEIEGLLRHVVFKDGKYKDQIIMSMLSEEYSCVQ